MRFTIVAFLVVAFMLMAAFSCSIEKRKHLPGYHVWWNSKPNKRDAPKRIREDVVSAHAPHDKGFDGQNTTLAKPLEPSVDDPNGPDRPAPVLSGGYGSAESFTVDPDVYERHSIPRDTTDYYQAPHIKSKGRSYSIVGVSLMGIGLIIWPLFLIGGAFSIAGWIISSKEKKMGLEGADKGVTIGMIGTFVFLAFFILFILLIIALIVSLSLL